MFISILEWSKGKVIQRYMYVKRDKKLSKIRSIHTWFNFID